MEFTKGLSCEWLRWRSLILDGAEHGKSIDKTRQNRIQTLLFLYNITHLVKFVHSHIVCECLAEAQHKGRLSPNPTFRLLGRESVPRRRLIPETLDCSCAWIYSVFASPLRSKKDAVIPATCLDLGSAP